MAGDASADSPSSTAMLMTDCRAVTGARRFVVPRPPDASSEATTIWPRDALHILLKILFMLLYPSISNQGPPAAGSDLADDFERGLW
ncbi:hypothetical protein TI01_1113 [Lysobacter sp. A03]|nr:hypothetical protein TI01_1113 [Lysobacter sp. A03]